MQCVDLGGRRIIKKCVSAHGFSRYAVRRVHAPPARVAGCFFQAEDGIRDVERSRGLGDVYKRQGLSRPGIEFDFLISLVFLLNICLLYTSPSPRDLSTARMPSSA